MKKFINILLIVFVLGLVASCAKEEIIPMGQPDSNRKSGSLGVTTVGDGDTKDDNATDDDEDINDIEIRDPDNDFD